MSNELPVLIVGAGPTGLMLACELARHGVRFSIIDKKPERTLASNATWVQTRTLEILDHIGVVSQFLKAGHPCSAINLYIDGKHLVKIPLNSIESIYPFILMLPQSETERLLTERLNELKHQVERSQELIEVKCEADWVVSTLKSPDGKIKTVSSKWLIACDGANSTIREKCRIFFPGEDLREQFVVADAKINSFMAKGEIHVFFDKGTLFAASPLGENKYRIAANLHLSHPRQTFYEHEVINLVQERGHGEYYVTDIAWISPFWVHGKVAEQLRNGNIFLAGDAAHIHSPAGGQGMNVGMQDAYNLAWKLALVIKGKAKPSLLDTYQAERYPAIKEIVSETENFTKAALFDKSFLAKLRKFSNKIQEGDTELAKKISDTISQVGIQYRDSPVIHYQEKPKAGSPQPGERAPDVGLSKAQHLYDYLRNAKYNVLIFAGPSPTPALLAKIKEFQENLSQVHDNVLKVQVVVREKVNDLENIILDPADKIAKRYKAQGPCFYVIRPDTYLGLYASEFDKTILNRYMEKCLL